MRLTFAALLLTTLAACGGSSDTATPAPSDSATTTPAVSTWSIDEAGKQYLKMVKPSNDAAAKVTELTEDDSTPFAQVAKACGPVVKADDKFMRDLNTGNWPVEVRQQVKDLVTELAAARAGMQSCASATSLDDVIAGLDQARNASKGAAQVLRVTLGLPGTE
jgi:hypothetical protein